MSELQKLKQVQPPRYGRVDGDARSAADWVAVAVCAPHQAGGAGGQDLGSAFAAGLHPR